MIRRSVQTGFTLIELLAAVAIFAVLALMTQQALMAALSTEGRLSVRRSELADLQRAVTVLGRDLENVAPRAVRDSDGEPLALFAIEVGGEGLVFTRGGLPNPAGLPRSGYQRVRYVFNGSTEGIERHVWRRIDPAPLQSAEVETLLGGVEGVRFRVWADEGGWRDAWPEPEDPDALKEDPDTPKDPDTLVRLPEGIEVVLQTRRFGLVRRVVSLR